MRSLELRRHAKRDADADRLHPDGQIRAEAVGRTLQGPYGAVYSSPARRAAETVAWFLRGLGHQLPARHGIVEGLSSPLEDRWRAAAKQADWGPIDRIERVDRELVQQESARLAAEVHALLADLPDDTRALAIGHSPLIEAAVYGVTGRVIEPLRQCEGVLLEDDGRDVRLAEELRLEG